MAVNKVVYGNNTLMDITDTTATAEDVASGKVFYGANGTRTTGSASYTETDPIYSASAAATISSSDITNWNSKVSATDYANENTGGVIKSMTYFSTAIGSTGTLYCEENTYSQYQSKDNRAFISKGTLENVITGKGLLTSNTSYFKSTSYDVNLSTNRWIRIATLNSGMSHLLAKLSLAGGSGNQTIVFETSIMAGGWGSQRLKILNETHVNNQIFTKLRLVLKGNSNGYLEAYVGNTSVGNNSTYTKTLTLIANLASDFTFSTEDINGEIPDGWTATEYNIKSGEMIANSSDIPTVNNATLTIQKNGSNVATFTANSSSNQTANILVPTKVSELTNDSGFITATDYASPTTGGVITTDQYYGTQIVNGKLLSVAKPYSDYTGLSDSVFISKGTLENVITGKGLATADDLVVKTIDFTSTDLTTLKGLFNTYSTIASNEFDYDKKGLYKIIFPSDDGVTYGIGTLHSGTYDPTGHSHLEFDVLPGGTIYDKDEDVTIKRVVLSLRYWGDGTSYDDIEDYSLNSYVSRVASQITVLDFEHSNNDERLKLFQTFGQTSLIDDYSNQTMKNYGLYHIIVPIKPYGTTYTGVYFGTLIGGSYNETGVSYLTFSVLSGGHNYQDDYIPSTEQLMVSYTYNDGSYTLSTVLHSNISTSISSTSDDYTYPTSKAVYDFVTSQGGGGGSATDVQINGTSITSNGTANILTNTAYNASSNKIATMSDVPSLTNYVTNTDYAGTAAAGVIMTASGAGTYTGATGILYSSAITYANYPSYSNNGFISKGTLENVITGKNLISTSGATMAGALVAQNNTNYTTKQVRNVVFSTSDPTSSDGGNGDIWIKYS